MSDAPRREMLDVDSIKTDGGTQSRVALSEEKVSEYADSMINGDNFPSVVVFHDGSVYWLADGFHRVLARRKARIKVIEAEVRVGTRRDAILFSVGANNAHGLGRTNEDKRRAVHMLLEDEEWSQWSDHEIGKRACVTHQYVGKLRKSSLAIVASDGAQEADATTPVLPESPPKPAKRTYTNKHGKKSKMNTEAIGKKKDKSEIVETPKDREQAFTCSREATNWLQRIGVNNPARREALENVARWIKANK